MNNTNWDEFKCRCSAISKILSNSRSNPQLSELQSVRLKELEGKTTLTDKQQFEMAALLVKKDNSSKVILSGTCIEYLMDVYAWETEGMIPVSKESLEILQMEKGTLAEKQAAELLGFVDDVVYEVHKDRIFNDYLSGQIDLYLGRSVYEANSITDIKNAFDYPTFLKKINNGLENGQEQQVQGYCDITNASRGWIANCLVDNPEEIIQDMKWKIAKKMNAVTLESPEFLVEWAKWERSMKFNHIAPQKRVHKIEIEPFSDFDRQKVYDRVKVCREYLWKFHEEYENMNKTKKHLDSTVPYSTLDV